MKVALAAFLSIALTSASAQKLSVALPASCGPRDASFSVRLDKSKHAVTEPEPGMARIYFISDSGSSSTMLGIDGAWVGAIRAGSFYSVTLIPGEHHFCVAYPPVYRDERFAKVAHLEAEAGKTYFFRLRGLEHGSIDSDAGKIIIPGLPLSVSRPKK